MRANDIKVGEYYGYQSYRGGMVFKVFVVSKEPRTYYDHPKSTYYKVDIYKPDGSVRDSSVKISSRTIIEPWKDIEARRAADQVQAEERKNAVLNRDKDIESITKDVQDLFGVKFGFTVGSLDSSRKAGVVNNQYFVGPDKRIVAFSVELFREMLDEVALYKMYKKAWDERNG